MLSLTLAAIIAVSTPQQTRTIDMVATSYCEKGPTKYGGWEHPAGRGVVATDPKVIPPGTKLYVEGYGYATAWDTGTAIKGDRIDVWLPTRKQALQWGRKTVQVTILGGQARVASRGEGLPTVRPGYGLNYQIPHIPGSPVPVDPFSLDSLLHRPISRTLIGNIRPP